MSILFNEIVFGPIKSRRFGNSLGINLLPLDNKICNFNCIYCECGWTDLKSVRQKFIDKKIIISSIKNRFEELSLNKTPVDTITFAGNGEPTMHPAFEEIIDQTIFYRNKFFPKVKIAVLSNSALLGNYTVHQALMKVDLRILKLDAGSNEVFKAINLPLGLKHIDWYVDQLKKFNGDVIIQTIFLKGLLNNQFIDNTKEEELNKWIEKIKIIHPKSVMIYTIDRETPAQGLHKIDADTLEKIADKLKAIGIDAKVYL